MASRGEVAVGSASAIGTAPAGFVFPEGVIGFAGPLFDQIVLSAPGSDSFAIGQIDVPEPASLLLLAAGFAGLALIRWRGAAVLAAYIACAAPASAQLALREKVTTAQEIVVSANPLATQAGAAILAAGGNAIDASIAVEAVLGLTEPQASGIGGGGFVLYYDAASRAVTSFDAREAAPATAPPSYFLGPDGRPLGFSTAVFSGKSVGVPTVVKLWDLISRRYGSRPLASVLQPAIQLANQGFPISLRMAASIDAFKTVLAQDPAAARLLPQPRRLRQGSGHHPAQPGLRADAVAHSIRRAARILPGPERAGHRHRGHHRQPPGRAGPAVVVRPRQLPRDRADAGLRPVSRLRRLRHGAAVLGRHRHAAGSRHAVLDRPRGVGDRTTCRRCTPSCRPTGSPSPTATSMSPILISSPCRSPG